MGAPRAVSQVASAPDIRVKAQEASGAKTKIPHAHESPHAITMPPAATGIRSSCVGCTPRDCEVALSRSQFPGWLGPHVASIVAHPHNAAQRASKDSPIALAQIRR